ncbi:MAG: hypothetical protein ACR2P1_05250 [Pseudomonadales bacterium]
MADGMTDAQKLQLKRVWLDCGGQERLCEDYIAELAHFHFLDYAPELIAGSHKKNEAAESRNFAAVANSCDNLLEAMKAIPDLDRLNLLSPREERPEYGGKNVP